MANQKEIDESRLPNFWVIVGIILIPLVLIILDSLAGVLRYVLQYSGLGGVIRTAAASMPLVIVVLAFILSALVTHFLLRILQTHFGYGMLKMTSGDRARCPHWTSIGS